MPADAISMMERWYATVETAHAFVFRPAAGRGVRIVPATSLSRSCSPGLGSAWIRGTRPPAASGGSPGMAHRTGPRLARESAPIAA
ncbi:hypothetical protein DBP15_04705 [Streptomyces sp. CS065A]|nr:hypothetical protein DBP15_04705 [Streptomyces sp. CS065A]